MKKSILGITLALVTAALSMPAAYADTVNLTINDPIQEIGMAGGTLYYEATVSAPSTNSALVYLNGDSYSLAGAFRLDDSPFLLNFPLDLAPGQSYTGSLFAITVPANSSVGLYNGSFQMLGGSTGSDNAVLTSATFRTAVSPEPSSLFLLGTGLIGAFAFHRRMRPTGTRTLPDQI